MAKVERMTANNEREVLYAFECPACGVSHAARVASQAEGLELWTFNGDLNRPTFYPSIGTTWARGRVAGRLSRARRGRPDPLFARLLRPRYGRPIGRAPRTMAR